MRSKLAKALRKLADRLSPQPMDIRIDDRATWAHSPDKVLSLKTLRANVKPYYPLDCREDQSAREKIRKDLAKLVAEGVQIDSDERGELKATIYFYA